MTSNKSFVLDAHQQLNHAATSVSKQLEYVADNKRELRSAANGPRPLTGVQQAIKLLPTRREGVAAWWFRPQLPTPASILARAIWNDARTSAGQNRYNKSPGKLHQAGRMMAEHILPMAGISIDHADVRQGVISTLVDGECASAEKYFVQALTATNHRERAVHRNVTVYHDDKGVPLAFQKSHDSDTALTLVPIETDSLLIPAGTIAVMDFDMTESPTGRSVGRPGDCKFETFEVTGDISLSPLRLSPWAFDDAFDIGMYALSGTGVLDTNVLEQRHKRLIGHDLDAFRGAAQQILTACNVTAV